jgi:hypothetical protein
MKDMETIPAEKARIIHLKDFTDSQAMPTDIKITIAKKKAAKKPLYLPIFLSSILFMLVLHTVGMILVPQYMVFKNMHAFSLLVVGLTCAVLMLLTNYSSKILND